MVHVQYLPIIVHSNQDMYIIADNDCRNFKKLLKIVNDVIYVNRNIQILTKAIFSLTIDLAYRF